MKRRSRQWSTRAAVSDSFEPHGELATIATAAKAAATRLPSSTATPNTTSAPASKQATATGLSPSAINRATDNPLLSSGKAFSTRFPVLCWVLQLKQVAAADGPVLLWTASALRSFLSIFPLPVLSLEFSHIRDLHSPHFPCSFSSHRCVEIDKSLIKLAQLLSCQSRSTSNNDASEGGVSLFAPSSIILVDTT